MERKLRWYPQQQNQIFFVTKFIIGQFLIRIALIQSDCDHHTKNWLKQMLQGWHTKAITFLSSYQPTVFFNAR